MEMRVTVDVTAEDIEKGRKCDCWQCPIASALWRTLGVKFSVGNFDGTIYPLGRKAERVKLPRIALDFMNKFDREGKGEPFAFQIEVPNSHTQGGETCHQEFIPEPQHELTKPTPLSHAAIAEKASGNWMHMNVSASKVRERSLQPGDGCPTK